jgi:hypothetical protein
MTRECLKRVICFDTEQSNIDGYLLRDSEYPCMKFLLTPYLQPQSRQKIRYNRSHKVTRCGVNAQMGNGNDAFIALNSTLFCSQIGLHVVKVQLFAHAYHRLDRKYLESYQCHKMLSCSPKCPVLKDLDLIDVPFCK